MCFKEQQIFMQTNMTELWRNLLNSILINIVQRKKNHKTLKSDYNAKIKMKKIHNE